MVGSLVLPALAVSPVPEEEQEAPKNALERIEEASGGNVTFDIPADILDLLLKEQQQQQQRKKTTAPLKKGLNKVDGFRIQVFSDGRNQSTLERRAKARGNAIAARFPKYRGQVYTYSSSPNWFTRVGNFETQAEASSAMSELRRAFPDFAGDMRVVKSKIIVIK